MTITRSTLDNGEEVYMSKFQQWRKRERLTLEELSDLTGYSAPMLNRVERGERSLSRIAKVRIARRLGVRLGELFPVEQIPDEGSWLRDEPGRLPPTI